MALNPATTTGTGGWGLAPVGTASQSTMPLAPTQQSILTPEQIAQLRQQSVAMQTPPTQNIQSWTQGVAELVRAMQGNREADFARQQELQGRQQGADAIGKIYATYLSQGGSSPSAAGAAPAGTLGSGPAGATASADSPTPSDANTPAALAATADASAPRGIRNNNPLNIEDGQFARGQPGYAGSDGRFAKFETPEHGVSAADKLLNSYQANQGLNTINGIVGRWAPSTDGNNTKAYAAHVAAQMGIGPNDPIPPAMRPQLIAAMAAHENGIPLPPAATKVPQAAPTGLLAPIQPPATPPAAVPPTAAAPSPAPTQLAYAGTGPIPPGMVPNPVTQASQGPGTPPGVAPMVNAIAGRPMPPAAPTTPQPIAPSAAPIAPPDFVRQAAAMEAAKASAPQAPLPSPGAAIPPADFAAQVAAMEAAKGAPNQPPIPASGAPPIAPADFAKMAATMEAMKAGAPASPPSGSAAVVPPTQTAAIPPAPPIAAGTPPAAPLPPAFLPTGSAIPGAVGPTSVNGAPLAIPPPFGATSVNGAPLPQRGTPPTNPALVSFIAGQNLPPNAAPTAGTGSPIPGAPPQVAQNGPPAGAAPSPAGGPAGLPSPLTSPTGQVTQAQLTQVLANPWVSESAKASMLQMIQQRGQPQSMPVEGGTLMFNAAGQKVFIPEPKMGTVKIGGAEIPTVSHFDPASGRWNTQTLAPGGGVQTGAPSSDGGGPMPHPAQAQGGIAQPDLSSIGGIQAAEVAQAGAKKQAEEQGTTTAKTFNTIYTGVTGDAFNAARQAPIVDVLQRIAPAALTGAGSDAMLALNRVASQLGINPEGAAPRELFNQLSAKVLADQFANIRNMSTEEGSPGGRIFKSMLDLEEKANITPDDSLAGVQAKLAFIKNSGDMLQRWGNMADDYVKEHGALDPGFMKALRSDIASQKFDNIMPEADASSPTGMKTAPTAPVSKVINGKTYYQINGKVYDNPEGK